MSLQYGEVPAGGIISVPPSIPTGMLYRVKSLAGISKQANIYGWRLAIDVVGTALNELNKKNPSFKDFITSKLLFKCFASACASVARKCACRSDLSSTILLLFILFGSPETPFHRALDSTHLSRCFD